MHFNMKRKKCSLFILSCFGSIFFLSHKYEVFGFELLLSWFSRKSEQDVTEEDRKIAKNDFEKEVDFSVEIKPDMHLLGGLKKLDSMEVQIFTDLPDDNPFQLAAPSEATVYQQLSLEDPHTDVTQALEGTFIILFYKITKIVRAL